jgi:hypothetical protein
MFPGTRAASMEPLHPECRRATPATRDATLTSRDPSRRSHREIQWTEIIE